MAAAKTTARKGATTRRRKERKNIERGAAHIQSTFNNTIVTITDAQGVALCIGNGNHGIVERGADMHLTLFNILALTTALHNFLAFSSSHLHSPPYFFLLATVRFGPLRVRALVLERWPRTGRPLR